MIWNALRNWFLLASFSLPFPLTAQVHRGLLPPDDSLFIQGKVEFLVDSGGQWTLTNVRQRAGLFRIAENARRLVGVNHPFQWLRVRISNQATRPMPLIANLNYPYLDEAHFYLLTDSEQLVAHSGPLDWTILPARRPLNHRNPLFPFTLAPGQKGWIYVQLARVSGPVVVTLRVQTARQFDTYDRQERLFWNWTLGVLCYRTNWLVCGQRIFISV